MNKILVALCLLISNSVVTFAQSLEKDFPVAIQVKITNPLAVQRDNVLVQISPEQLKKTDAKFNAKAFVVIDNGKEIPSQYNARDTKGSGVLFVLDKLAASESRILVLRYHPTASVTREYTKRTQAELSHRVGGAWQNREYKGGTFKNVDYLRVPPEHKDHSWFIRYEGPGWESDKVGYRFYLDQRNANDVFGKTTSAMILKQVGQDGFDSYHNMQPWGMDVMKVGKSLGIGAVGAWLSKESVERVEKTDSVTCRILENGNVFSSFVTNYYGWKVEDKKHNVSSRMSIHAGTRLTHTVLDITNNPQNICTGIVQDSLAKVFHSKGDKAGWGYLATYGKQSLNNDGLGLAILFNADNSSGFAEDAFNHVVKLKGTQGKLEYYLLAAWVGETDGIQNEQEFLQYLQRTAKELAAPVTVQLNKTKK